jgi:uncharacterized membrane protein
MRTKAEIDAMIGTMIGQSSVTRAPDFIHGVIDALLWTIADWPDGISSRVGTVGGARARCQRLARPWLGACPGTGNRWSGSGSNRGTGKPSKWI